MQPQRTTCRTRDEASDLARSVVESLGGRYSVELGIDVDGGEDEIERWALAATLFGGRISAKIAQRTFATFEDAGVHSLATAGRVDPARLVELLDAGGYARYDFQTARRLRAIADTLERDHDGRVSAALEGSGDDVAAALKALPGWGPVTVALFLRELRGVRHGLDPPVDTRAQKGGEHLGLLAADSRDVLARLRDLAGEAHTDVRDLEAALVRLSLAHRRGIGECPGRTQCKLLARRS